MSDHMNRMRELTASMTNEALIGALMLVPYSDADTKTIRASRAVMVDEYIARFGQEDGERIMDELGL